MGYFPLLSLPLRVDVFCPIRINFESKAYVCIFSSFNLLRELICKIVLAPRPGCEGLYKLRTSLHKSPCWSQNEPIQDNTALLTIRVTSDNIFENFSESQSPWLDVLHPPEPEFQVDFQKILFPQSFQQAKKQRIEKSEEIITFAEISVHIWFKLKG